MTAGAGPRGPDFRGFEERARAQLAELTRLMDDAGRQHQSGAQERAEQETARTKAARRGDLGPQWQRVQERIDTNRSSLHAVFAGEDDSPAAAALRDTSRSHLTSLAPELQELAEHAQDGDPVAALKELSVDLQARAAELADRMGHVDRPTRTAH